MADRNATLASGDTPTQPTVLSEARQADLALMARIAGGDRGAMQHVFKTYHAPLQSFARSWLASPHDAADIVNEVMLDVWRKAARFEGRSSLKSWIFTIARNKSVDANRKGSRLSYTDIEPEIEDETPSAVAHVASQQDAIMIRECMQELSGPHRRALHLAFFEELSYAEIARIEDCPVGTIKTRVMHAKKLLRHAVSSRGRG